MYNTKYRLAEIEELNGHNSVHDEMKGNICYLAYLNHGERGWFLIDTGEKFNPVHRIHTSVVKDVKYTRGKQVIVTTKNTKYIFEAVIEMP